MFSEALSQIVERLHRAQKERLLYSYALIGGFAASAWGVARATQDIDLAVALGTSDPQALATHLEATYEPGGIDDPLRGVFRLSLKCEGQEVPVQLIVLPAKVAAIAFNGVETLAVLGYSVPVVNWRALVLLILYAGGASRFTGRPKCCGGEKTQRDRSRAPHRTGRCIGSCSRSAHSARILRLS